MNYVKWVKENRSKLKNYEWLKQFDENTDGHRFTPMKFMGMKIKYGMDEVPDGIAGERWMRQHMKSKIFEGATLDMMRRGLTNDECNDIINYSAWNAFDILSLRVSEGLSEIIPRAQYEWTAFIRHFVRGDEWMKLFIYEVGWEKYMKRIYQTRFEIGADIGHLGKTWASMNSQMFGFIALESLGIIDPDDPLVVDKKYWTVYPWVARAYAMRGADGSLYETQDRYVYDMDQSVVDFLMNNMETLEGKKLKLFQQVDAVATMLAFDMHYDNRDAQQDRGPHIVEDGKIMMMRTCYLNDPMFYWSEPCERRNIPFSLTIAFVINPEKIGLQEIRCNGIGTTFSQPGNLWEGMERGCMFLRYEPDGPEPLPLSKLKKLEWSEVPDLVQNMEDAIFDWYSMITNMPPRIRITNGSYDYLWSNSHAPLFRAFGLWEKYGDALDYWEWPPVASEGYYQAKGKVATEIMPIRLFTGGGWTDLPDKVASTSKYREVLKKAFDLGWESDLTGLKPIPDELKPMFDEDRRFCPKLPFNVSDDWMK